MPRRQYDDRSTVRVRVAIRRDDKAAIGLSGVTTGPHVHWETKVNGQLVNPLTVQP